MVQQKSRRSSERDIHDGELKIQKLIITMLCYTLVALVLTLFLSFKIILCLFLTLSFNCHHMYLQDSNASAYVFLNFIYLTTTINRLQF